MIIQGIEYVNSVNAPKSCPVLAEELNLNEEQEAVMVKISAEYGIGKIVSASCVQAGETQTSYYLEDGETKHYGTVEYAIVLLVDNEMKVVDAIHFHSQDLYIYGAVVNQITDFYVSDKEHQQYIFLAKIFVKETLNYPDTTKIPAASGWAFDKTYMVITVPS